MSSEGLPIPATSKSIVLNHFLDEGVPDAASFSIIEGECEWAWACWRRTGAAGVGIGGGVVGSGHVICWVSQ